MLIKAKDLKGYKLSALDGEIGSVKEFYFDDRFWTIRYLVVDTGSWLAGRVVLISPYAVTSVDRERRLVSVDLTKREIEDSPSMETDKPVSKQFEDSYYNWPTYWSGPFSWGLFYRPSDAREHWKRLEEEQKHADHDLRSTRDVTAHFIEATDGEVGHVEDFIVDTEQWAIRYLEVGTRNWWLGKLVLIAPLWIDSIDWAESKVYVGLTRNSIKLSPPYTESTLLQRDYETLLHEHYDREGYWERELAEVDQVY